jgi:hypothetical protein
MAATKTGPRPGMEVKVRPVSANWASILAVKWATRVSRISNSSIKSGKMVAKARAEAGEPTLPLAFSRMRAARWLLKRPRLFPESKRASSFWLMVASSWGVGKRLRRASELAPKTSTKRGVCWYSGKTSSRITLIWVLTLALALTRLVR